MKRAVLLSCARAREELQAIHDRLDPASQGSDAAAEAGRLLSGQLRRHLESCPGCARFLRILSGYAPALKRELDAAVRAAWQQIPSVDYGPVPAAERAGGQFPAPLPGLRGHKPGAGRSRRERLRSWLRAPLFRPIPLVRWAALSFAALLLVSIVGLQVQSGLRTRRAVRAEIYRVIETIYREPLLAGVESGLERSHPTFSDYLNDMSRSREAWLEDLIAPAAPGALN